MPSSMIFVGLVVVWLLILVPAVARHRQEVARPSVAALSGRVLERPRQRRGPELGRWPQVGRELEVDVMDELDEPRSVATRSDRDREVRVPAARAEVRWADDDPGAADGEWAEDGIHPDDAYPEDARPDDPDRDDPYRDDPYPDDRAPLADGPHLEDDRDDEAGPEDRRWERPPPRYRPGRGGFDPEAAALAARARYGFRQRVVLAMLIVAIGTGVVAAAAVPGLWWPHAAVDTVLVGYLVYLRRQVRLEESIRERRAARMAGTRRPSAAEDPELDEWARRGRDVTSRGFAEPEASDVDGADDTDTDMNDADVTDADVDADSESDADIVDGRDDDLAREQPERIRGTGDPLWTAPEPTEAGALPQPVDAAPALPRLKPAPPPPLPAGTSLVEADEDDPALHDLDGPVRPDYRRAAGE